MLTRRIVGGAVDQSVVIRIVDSTDGTPETGVVAATSGLALEYRRELAANVALTESDLAALTTAHTDGGMLHIGNGYYRVDPPDAAFAAGVPGVLVHGVVTGMVVIGTYVEIIDAAPGALTTTERAAIATAVYADAKSGIIFSGTAAGGSTTAVTFPANSFIDDDSRLIGATLLAIAGAGVGQSGIINDFVAATEVATLNRTNSVAFDNTTQFVIYTGDIGLTAPDIAAGVFARAMGSKLTGVTFDVLCEKIAAILLGKSSGFVDGYGTAIFRDPADTMNEVAVIVDTSGNKTSTDLTP